MPSLFDLLIAFLVLIGHASLCVAFVNRSQAIDWPYPRLKKLKKVTLAFTFGVPLIYLLKWIITGTCLIPRGQGLSALLATPWGYYPIVCLLALVAAIPFWLLPKLFARTPSQLRKHEKQWFDLKKHFTKLPLVGPRINWAVKLPQNQILDVVVEHKQLAIANLPEGLVGLKIAHLSDFHMTGMYAREFYDWAVEETNKLGADIVVLTGDIAEHPDCIPWIVPTLGKLRAPFGKFYVLGNHDRRLQDVPQLRTALAEAGIQNVAGDLMELHVRGEKILLAGNELPWFGPAPTVQFSAERSSDKPEFRLLLTHTPDLFAWAKQKQFDLMLAGHNHGGQIRFPLIGALIAPSHYGTKYAGGLYFESPTLLHVSRGLAGVDPLRFNCPPELTLLELVR